MQEVVNSLSTIIWKTAPYIQREINLAKDLPEKQRHFNLYHILYELEKDGITESRHISLNPEERKKNNEMDILRNIPYQKNILPLVYRLKSDGLKKFEEDEYYQVHKILESV